MARPKEHEYEQTEFAKHIVELQQKHGYSDQYVVDNIVNENNATLIGNVQTYGSYKSGKRKNPRDFDDVLKAFAKFYDVTTDYLLGIDETPKPQVKSVQDATGLSESSVRKLILFKNKYPDIMKMIDVIISGSSDEDITYYISLYNQIYNDYKDSKLEITDSDYDMNKMQHRFLLTQSMYSYWQNIVTAALAPQFDREILEKEDRTAYEHSQEFIDSIPDIPNCDYQLETEDGEIIELKAEIYK